MTSSTEQRLRQSSAVLGLDLTDQQYDQLLAYATAHQIPVRADLDRATIIDRLILVLQVYDPKERLDAMVQLMQNYSALPLPGHGSSATLTLEQWLDAAGAPLLN